MKYIESRLPCLPIPHRAPFGDYLLGVFMSPGSGEYAVNAVLAPGGFSRKTLIDRVHELKVPVVFIYGEKDWNDKSPAYEIKDKQLVKDIKIEIVKDCTH